MYLWLHSLNLELKLDIFCRFGLVIQSNTEVFSITLCPNQLKNICVLYVH